MNPTGKCKCGCGGTTNIYKGEYRDYLNHHHNRNLISKRKPATCHPNKPVHGNGLCINCYNKKLYQDNPEYAERVRAKARKDGQILQEKRSTDPKLIAEHAAHQQNRRLKHRYGITIADYNKMLEEQNFVCVICGTEHSEKKKLHVDHNHETGAVRGLLCNGCNITMGVLEKGKDYLKKCFTYLEMEDESSGVQNSPDARRLDQGRD